LICVVNYFLQISVKCQPRVYVLVDLCHYCCVHLLFPLDLTDDQLDFSSKRLI